MTRTYLAMLASLLMVFASQGCMPDPSADCASVCSQMVKLYQVSTGTTGRPTNGVYGSDLTPTGGYCPLSWQPQEKTTPFLEYFVFEYLVDDGPYSVAACTQTCRDITFKGSAPRYSSRNFDFERCLAQSVTAEGAYKLYDTYLGYLSVSQIDVCDANELYEQCMDDLGARGAGTSDGDQDATESGEDTSPCDKSTLRVQCLARQVAATTDQNTLSCWLLESCRLELAAYIRLEELQ